MQNTILTSKRDQKGSYTYEQINKWFAIMKEIYLINRRFFARWLVESYGQGDYRPQKWLDEENEDGSRNGLPKSSMFLQKTNWTTISMVYTLTDNRNDVKMFACARFVVPLEVRTFWRHSMVDQSIDYGKLFSICCAKPFDVKMALVCTRVKNYFRSRLST